MLKWPYMPEHANLVKHAKEKPLTEAQLVSENGLLFLTSVLPLNCF